jgi:hypothetical protein
VNKRTPCAKKSRAVSMTMLAYLHKKCQVDLVQIDLFHCYLVRLSCRSLCLFCVIVLYVLTLTASDYHLGISKPLSCYNMTDVSCVFDNTCTYFNSFFKYIRTGDGVVFSPLSRKYFFRTIVFYPRVRLCS